MGSYSVVATQHLRQRLLAAPPAVKGLVVGLVAALSADPFAPSQVMRIGVVGDVLVCLFAGGRGVLTYRVLNARRLLVLLDLRWAA